MLSNGGASYCKLSLVGAVQCMQNRSKLCRRMLCCRLLPCACRCADTIWRVTVLMATSAATSTANQDGAARGSQHLPGTPGLHMQERRYVNNIQLLS
jgi:hypothetical protein